MEKKRGGFFWGKGKGKVLSHLDPQIRRIESNFCSLLPRIEWDMEIRNLKYGEEKKDGNDPISPNECHNFLPLAASRFLRHADHDVDT